MILGLHFGPPRRPKIKEFMISLRLSVRRAPWIVLGPLFAPFWNHFGVMLGSFFVDFRRCSVLFPMCAESCSGVACSCWPVLFVSPKTWKKTKKATGKGKRTGKAKEKGKGKGEGQGKGNAKGKGEGKSESKSKETETEIETENDKENEQEKD